MLYCVMYCVLYVCVCLFTEDDICVCLLCAIVCFGEGVFSQPKQTQSTITTTKRSPPSPLTRGPLKDLERTSKPETPK